MGTLAAALLAQLGPTESLHWLRTGSLIQATCSVTQSNVDVALPDINAAALTSGVGATVGPQAFSLRFNCAAGTKVLITLTDNVNPTNWVNTLKLTADSTAQGVGVQILNSGSPVSFGPDSAVVGNTNQWTIGHSPNGPPASAAHRPLHSHRHRRDRQGTLHLYDVLSITSLLKKMRRTGVSPIREN